MSQGTIEVLIPGRLSSIRFALATCAIEGNQFAIDALETIRRVEADESVGPRYAKALNDYLTKYHAEEINVPLAQSPTRP